MAASRDNNSQLGFKIKRTKTRRTHVEMLLNFRPALIREFAVQKVVEAGDHGIAVAEKVFINVAKRIVRLVRGSGHGLVE